MSIKNNTASLQQLLEVVNNLPDAGSGGIELPELTNPANTDEIFLNKEVIDENGKVKTGTFTIDNEINTQEDLLSELRAALSGKAGGGEQVAPEISVNASGLITATAGTKSSTYQMAFQPAKTITPSTASQVAVSSGYYTGGNITVAAIPSNYIVPSGTLTITENGTHDVKNYASATVEIAGGSGEQVEWSVNEDALVTGSLSSYYNDRVLKIRDFTFYSRSDLTSVNFPACTTIGSSAFYSCYNLTSINFPVCATIGGGAFYGCYNLTSINFPACTTIDSSAFYDCHYLTSANFPACTTIGVNTFCYCYSLTSANFPVCATIGGDAFDSCLSLATANFPACTTISRRTFNNCKCLASVSFPLATFIGQRAFRACHSLTAVSFPACTTIDNDAFAGCYNLKSIYLTGSALCKLSNSNAFTSTPIGGYSTSAGTYGSIYVPASLVSAYQSATNWVYFSSRITGIPSDY